MDLLVVAKSPVAGRVKTRLAPYYSPHEAAELAAAALADTLEAAVASGADRVVVALDGLPGEWLPPSATVVDQGEGTLAERLATAWSHVRGGALQIGMDTPQVTAALLRDGLVVLDGDPHDAALGPAEDGGWWALGLRRPVDGLFAGIPTSQPDTGTQQLARLEGLGLRTALLPTLRDVDEADDVAHVAALAPTSRFATTARRLQRAAAGAPNRP